MNKREKVKLVSYLYNMEQRLEDAVRDCNYRFVRRNLDSVDLLEQIICIENLKLFHQVSEDIVMMLSLSDEE